MTAASSSTSSMPPLPPASPYSPAFPTTPSSASASIVPQYSDPVDSAFPDYDALQRWTASLLSNNSSMRSSVPSCLPHDFPLLFSYSTEPLHIEVILTNPLAPIFVRSDPRLSDLPGVSSQHLAGSASAIHQEWHHFIRASSTGKNII